MTYIKDGKRMLRTEQGDREIHSQPQVINTTEIKRQYAITALSDKLDEIKDYASAGRKGNAAVSYDAIENLAWDAIKMLADIRGYMDGAL